MKNLLRIILVLIVIVLAIKYVPPVNDIARSNLPGPVLELMGEKPKNVFEKGLDQIDSVIDKIKS